MVEFKDYAINFLLVGLFVVSMFGFAGKIASNYGESPDIMGGDKINLSGIQNTVNATNDASKSWRTSFQSDSLVLTAGALVVYSIWQVGNLVLNSAVDLAVLFFDGITQTLGIPPVVTSVLIAILLISLIFALWRVIKAGN